MEVLETPSKSQRKRDMTALQNLGESLLGLNRHQLEQLSLPDTLLEAILDAKSITAHGARRRQLQFIGKLMRQVDPVPIQTFLAQLPRKPRT